MLRPPVSTACALACAALLAGCSEGELSRVLDDVAVKGACEGKPSPPVGGASDALWIACEGKKTFQVFDGKGGFRKVEVPNGAAAQQHLAATDKSLFVTTRDPGEPTTTNPRLLLRLRADGRTEDRTADVNPTKADELKLTGIGGQVVVLRGGLVYQVKGDAIAALPIPQEGNYKILGVLPVLGDGRLDRFLLHTSIGSGSPGAPEDVSILLWDGAAWNKLTVVDPTEALRYTGFPRLFVLVGGSLYGLANRVAPQDRIVPVTVAKLDGTTLTAVEYKISVEAGYFGPQQFFVRGDGKIVVLGTESEGNMSVVNRLAYYLFTGEDFRRRWAFQTIQDCAQQTCDRAASDPIFLVDGAVQYVVTDADGSFEVRQGKL